MQKDENMKSEKLTSWHCWDLRLAVHDLVVKRLTDKLGAHVQRKGSRDRARAGARKASFRNPVRLEHHDPILVWPKTIESYIEEILYLAHEKKDRGHRDHLKKCQFPERTSELWIAAANRRLPLVSLSTQPCSWQQSRKIELRYVWKGIHTWHIYMDLRMIMIKTFDQNFVTVQIGTCLWSPFRRKLDIS